LMRSAISLCLLFTVIHLPGGDWPRYTSPMKLELRIPEEHPYLALTPAKIERAAKSAAASAGASQYIDEILTQANGLVAPPTAGERRPRSPYHRGTPVHGCAGVCIFGR